MKPIINFVVVLAVSCAAAFTSCTKTTGDAYKKYTNEGEIVYPGRADSVFVRAGFKRVQLAIALGNDPLVTRLTVYWNNQLDSLEVPVTRTSGRDTVEVIIPDLQAGNYDFTVYTYDNAGHKSVPSNGSGTVFGDSYVSSLSNRTVNISQSPSGLQILLNWGEPGNGEVGTEVNYVADDGTAHKIIVPPTEMVTTLPDYEGGSELTYQSLYKPDSTAFENFSVTASKATLPLFERSLNKANFQKVVLPTDVLDNHGWINVYLWNNSIDAPGFATRNQVPCWFTFDAGESAAINRFKVWQATDRLYVGESVKTFELYGSNNPNPDGSWDSWTQIGGTYQSVKPSGQPVGQNTQADIDFAKAGEEFTAPAGTAKFRYYRFKLLTNWGNAPFMTMSEITFYTRDKN